MASVVDALKRHPAFDTKVCVTAQHRDMLDQVLALFGIQPDFDLNLMRTGQDLTDLTARVLAGMRDVFGQWRPDIVVVHGDTSTAMATGLAAFYQRIPVAHIEAGLRTGNPYSPWPEEINRKVVGTLAHYHFAPTPEARQNLLRENVPEHAIYVTGNTVIDALLQVNQRINSNPGLRAQLARRFPFIDPNKKLILLTGHRRENIGEGFENICAALARLVARPDVQVIYPLHPNPSVREPVARLLGGLSNIFLVEPQDYLPFVYLMSVSTLILTDSGGIQEEAPALGKPVLLMRDTTERPEGVAAGTVRLTGTNSNRIIEAVNQLLDDEPSYAAMARAHNPYGDGRAAARIVDILQTGAFVHAQV